MADRNYKIITNYGSSDFEDLLMDLSKIADYIKIATAFFSDTKLISRWEHNSKTVDLLVSLRPPTNYYSLLSIYSKKNVNIQFLGNEFHSKFFIFYRNSKPFAFVIGSSNLTAGGLYKNIETNTIIKDENYLKEIDREFSALWKVSYQLQPTDLDGFKIIFDTFAKKADSEKEELDAFETKILSGRSKKADKPRIGRHAKEHHNFCAAVNQIKAIVSEISEEEYPSVPIYLVIDHFWHWVVVKWDRTDVRLFIGPTKKQTLQKIFREYCSWDKNENNYTFTMADKSSNIFASLLAENKIDYLTDKQAVTIISNLHSGAMRTRRFGADRKFVAENSIDKIRSSFKYLLYSNEELDLRIHNLYINPKYKLKQLSLSGIQELIGWVMPEKYPIRNEKANDAVEILGYNFR